MEDRDISTRSMKDVVLKWGGIMGAFEIVLNIMLYIFDETMMVSGWKGIVSVIVAIVVSVMAVRELRTAQAGYINFSIAFMTALLTLAFGLLINMIFGLLLFFVIDTDLADRMTKVNIENTIAMMEKFGVPEDQLDEMLEQAEKDSAMTVGNYVKGSFYMLIFYGVVALIIGAIMKRKRPEYEV